jgi:membrane protease YdiL (CAAX protease family)
MRSWIESAALAIALAFPAVMAWLYFVAASPAPGTGPSLQMQSLYFAGKVVQFTLPVACWALTNPSRLGNLRPKWTGLGPAVAFGIFSLVGIVGVYFFVLKGTPLLAAMPEQVRRKVGELGIHTPERYLLFAAFISLAHALLEEYYWRAFVFDGLRRRLQLWVAVLISAASFAAHHIVVLHVYSPDRFFTGLLPLTLGIMLGGGVWAWLYHRAGSVWPCWLSHALVDIAIMAVGYDMVFG